MLFRKHIVTYLLLIIMFGFPAATAAEISVIGSISSQFYPQQENALTNGVSGNHVEFMDLLLSDSGLGLEPKFMPMTWSKVLGLASKEQPALILDIARTAEREKQYHWIGQLDTIEFFFISNAGSDIDLSAKDNTKNLVISVHRNDFKHGYLLEKGFKKLVPVDSANQIFGLLELNRVDVTLTSKVALDNYCQKRNNCERFQILKKVDELNQALYLAANLATPEEHVTILTHTFTKLESDTKAARLLHTRTVN